MLTDPGTNVGVIRTKLVSTAVKRLAITGVDVMEVPVILKSR
ncbi:MAG: hypothetical protein BWY74_02459 [Firmicutes bacterium ADurb.Bin419]|nr:MAG: hypothetical protein BWY74_02459 [Firmicutes bacterium ADurb.Bin419]